MWVGGVVDPVGVATQVDSAAAVAFEVDAPYVATVTEATLPWFAEHL